MIIRMSWQLDRVDDIGLVSELLKERLLVDARRCLIVADGGVVAQVAHVFRLHRATLLRLDVVQVFVSVLLHTNKILFNRANLSIKINNYECIRCKLS